MNLHMATNLYFIKFYSNCYLNICTVTFKHAFKYIISTQVSDCGYSIKSCYILLSFNCSKFYFNFLYTIYIKAFSLIKHKFNLSQYSENISKRFILSEYKNKKARKPKPEVAIFLCNQRTLDSLAFNLFYFITKSFKIIQLLRK